MIGKSTTGIFSAYIHKILKLYFIIFFLVITVLYHRKKWLIFKLEVRKHKSFCIEIYLKIQWKIGLWIILHRNLNLMYDYYNIKFSIVKFVGLVHDFFKTKAIFLCLLNFYANHFLEIPSLYFTILFILIGHENLRKNQDFIRTSVELNENS